MGDTPPRERRQTNDRRQTRRGGRRIADLATYEDRYITPQQLADYLGAERRQVNKWILAGILPAYRFAERTWRIELSEAVVFVERHRLCPDAHLTPRATTRLEPT